MAGFEDVLKNHPVELLGVGALLAAPLASPSIRPQWTAAAKEIVKLFLEAEFDAQGDLIDALAETTVEQLVALLAAPPAARGRKAARIASHFKRKARGRANRWGRSDGERAERYRDHIAALKRRLSSRPEALCFEAAFADA